MKMTRKIILFALTLILVTNVALAHCQIPCGIYGDSLRFDLMREHIATVEKSMKMIRELAEQPGENANQLVRWVNNKEEHADDFTHIVTWYFLAQRIKPDTDNYHQKLEVLHRMQITAMKCKQGVEPGDVAELKALVDRFEQLYLTEAARGHVREHTAHQD